jgi:MOSC domain-containing protein YiiM
VSRATPVVRSVNVARAAPLTLRGRTVMSAIGKQPVAGPVSVHPLGLDGDEQADLSVHGGLPKAVYAYAVEHHAFWRTVRAQARASRSRQTARFDDGTADADAALMPGAFGENLLLEGILETDVWIGDLLRLPDCDLRVSEPRFPCFKFDAAMGFPQAAKMMAQSGYCGFYLAVARPGSVTAGDAIELVPGPREVGIVELFRARLAGR